MQTKKIFLEKINSALWNGRIVLRLSQNTDPRIPTETDHESSIWFNHARSFFICRVFVEFSLNFLICMSSR